MLKDVILKQKLEKERFLALEYIPRTKDDFGKKWLDSNLIKVILGPRRAGKSIFALMLLKGRPFMYFNFDDEVLSSVGGIVTDELMGKLHSVYGDVKNILFDEIQKVDNWQEQVKVIYDIHKKNIKMIISGSESLFIFKKSKESLAGRIYEFKIDTLTFREFIKFKGVTYGSPDLYRKEYAKLFEEFMLSGGFPELCGIDDKEKIKMYIKEGIRDKILYKDIPSLFKVGDISALNSILESITENPGQLIDISNFSNENKMSRPTLANYLRYLEDSFLIKKIYNFSKNKRKVERKLKKYYPALISIDLLFNNDDLSKSKAFENAIINQLKVNFFWRDPYKHEVDAILTENEITPIEIKYGKIETKGLSFFMDKFKIKEGFIISKDEEGEIKADGRKIKIIPAWKWLLAMNSARAGRGLV